ncbi:fructose-bisphosphatase class III [bacterium]|nr:fructose-bisphosphatase class III [bacterium]
MAIVIGDVHGCFKTMEALLKRLPDDKIFFVGDLIDRGPRSKQVVQFLIDHPEMQCTKGNHEDWALSVLGNATFSEVCSWTHPRNGGQATITSYELAREGSDKSDKSYCQLLPVEHEDYLKSLPIFIEEGDLFISHTAYCGFDWNSKEQWEDMKTWDKRRGLLWYRGDAKKVIKDGKEFFHIFGHSPVPGAEIGEFYANIDTGACFDHPESLEEGYGILTALQYPSMKKWTQGNID